MSGVELSTTTLNVGTGGDAIVDEAVTMADGSAARVPVSKLLVAAGRVGDLVSEARPLPVTARSSGRSEDKQTRGTGLRGRGHRGGRSREA